MLLSVIVPAYNAQRYLSETIQSLLSQPCRNLQIIIVNDGSTDDTGAIADSFAATHSHIQVIHSENRGVSHARNLGLDAASGDYVAFLDADDVWCRDVYDREIEQQLLSGEHDILSFGFIFANHTLTHGRPCPVQKGTLLRTDPEYDLACRKPFCSYLYRRELTKQVRFPDGIRYNEDSAFLFLITRLARSMLRSDRFCFLYRNNIHSAMHKSLNFDYILTDEIPAWSWAGIQSRAETDRQVCDGMVYSLIGEYLLNSSKAGVPVKQLQKNIRECSLFHDVCSRFGQFWTHQKTVQLLEDFSKAPVRTWLRCRVRGFLPMTLPSAAAAAVFPSEIQNKPDSLVRSPDFRPSLTKCLVPGNFLRSKKASQRLLRGFKPFSTAACTQPSAKTVDIPKGISTA